MHIMGGPALGKASVAQEALQTMVPAVTGFITSLETDVW